MIDILEILFGSAQKVRILKLFLLNPEKAFDVSEVSMRAKTSPSLARREVTGLEKAGLVKKVSYIKEIRKLGDRKVVLARKKADGWTLDPKFSYIEATANFLSNINPFKHSDIVDKISKAGKIQLLIISGVFIKYPDARVDLLVVGDGLKENLLLNIIGSIEADLGTEIKYAFFETSDFRYRMNMFDRLVRDILDYPHEKVINKLGL